MTIIEYILNSDRPSIPSYVVDGGYWMNPDDSQKMIGVGLEGSIPDNIETFTLEELQARQRAIHADYPMTVRPTMSNDVAENMTDDEVNAAIKAWVDARS